MSTMLQISETISIVNYYDTIFSNNLLKDFQMLTTSTGIAIGALVLDIFQRTW